MDGTSDGKEQADVQPASATKPRQGRLWRRASLMVAFRDAMIYMKTLKNSRNGVNTKTIAKFITQQSDTPPTKILPRLHDIIHRAECMGMVTKVASGTYVLEDKDIDLCGVCGGMKKRRKKSSCGKERRKRSRSKSRCGKKRKRRSRSKSRCRKKRRSRSRKSRCGKKRRSRSRKKSRCGKKRRSRSRRKSRCKKKRRSRSRRKSRCGKKRRSRSRKSRCKKNRKRKIRHPSC